MGIASRLDRLEAQVGLLQERPPSVAAVMAARRQVERWLAAGGLTVEQAHAAGLAGPSAMVPVAALVEARQRAAEWRRERFRA